MIYFCLFAGTVLLILVIIGIIGWHVGSKCSAGGRHDWVKEKDSGIFAGDGMNGGSMVYTYRCQKCKCEI